MHGCFSSNILFGRIIGLFDVVFNRENLTTKGFMVKLIKVVENLGYYGIGVCFFHFLIDDVVEF